MEQLQEQILRLEKQCIKNSEEVKKLKSPVESNEENVILYI
jgi:hypothetical protein